MKSICFYFQIHQPFRLKTYRFFDIGNDHYYYDDFANDDIITRIAQRSYMPANQMLLDMIKENGKKFKVAFSISGTALEQLEQYVPEFIDSMKELADTGCVEFLSETYAHSLSSLVDPEEFIAQVKAHDEKIYQELLQEFTTSDVIQNIKSAFEMSDWDNYRFYVSRMIESSAAVGAEALSQEFQSLKKACINRRHNYILENHERVMELYANIVQKIQTGLATI